MAVKICEQCSKQFEGHPDRRFCSKSCAVTYRNLLPENRLKSAQICRERNKTPEMKEKASKNMKMLRTTVWENDPRIKEIYRETHSRVMKDINSSQGMNKPKKSEEVAKEYLESLGINFEREKWVELSVTRDSKGKFSGSYSRLDFYIPESNLDLEIDGSIHNSEYQISHDMKRDESLRELGLHVVRIKFTGDYDRLKEDIHTALQKVGVINE